MHSNELVWRWRESPSSRAHPCALFAACAAQEGGYPLERRHTAVLTPAILRVSDRMVRLPHA